MRRNFIRFVIVTTMAVLGAFFVPVQASANLPTFSSSEIEAWEPGPWPGNTVSVPAGFPAGSVARLSWKFSGGPFTNSAESFTVPDLVGSTMYVRLAATIPGYADFEKIYVQLIKCKMPDLAVVFEPGFPTPNTPAIMRITNPVAGSNFPLDVGDRVSGLINIQTVTAGESYRITVKKDYDFGVNNGYVLRLTRSKANCFSQSLNSLIPLGPQVLWDRGRAFGPDSGSEFRVGIPVVLKRLSLTSPNTSFTYRWMLGGVVVSNSESYTPKSNDVGKTLELYLSFSDSLAGWYSKDISVGREGSSFILPALPGSTPAPTPTPTPSASSRPVLNPQVPSQPRENAGGNPAQSPNPSPSVSPSAKPSTTPSPTSNPSPSAKPSSSSQAVVYKSCASLRLKFKNGVARDSKALSRYKLKTKPVLNSDVYSANARLDTDKDGLVCER